MKGLSKVAASRHEVGEEGDAQRIDNYLMRLLKGVPKSHVYRILRSGEVRVNSARADARYRLKAGDVLRLPPIRPAQPQAGPASQGRPAPGASPRILYEDDVLLALDKPSGLAVHGGSGVSVGLIEQMRRERPNASFLELVHRLDRDTSGVLLLAKKRAALVDLHAQLRAGSVRKVYLALVKGRWRAARRMIEAPLHKYVLPGGERRVRVETGEGRFARTLVSLKAAGAEFSLVEAELKTGRTHQIRVHLSHIGHPIAGDPKYGDYALNKSLARRGLKRMFLHACRLAVRHPASGAPVTFESPLPEDLAALADTLVCGHAATV
jgi:23S rRNA pseudouridine955/2504/2580 synthase